jgi:hypothetical protein
VTHDLVTSFLVAFARGDRLRATQPNMEVLLRADAHAGPGVWLKAHDLITSPAFIVMKAADE